MPDPLLKCSKCGAVMVYEDYHQYGWYLDGQRVEACPPEAEQPEVKVTRDDLLSILATLERADPQQLDLEIYQRLRAALEGQRDAAAGGGPVGEDSRGGGT